MQVFVNLQNYGRHKILAVCDAELIGKVLEEGNIVFEVREDFYKGLKVELDEAIALIRQCSIVNMVGPYIIESAVEKGLIHPDSVIKISNIPHAQIVRM